VQIGTRFSRHRGEQRIRCLQAGRRRCGQGRHPRLRGTRFSLWNASSSSRHHRCSNPRSNRRENRVAIRAMFFLRIKMETSLAARRSMTTEPPSASATACSVLPATIPTPKNRSIRREPMATESTRIMTVRELMDELSGQPVVTSFRRTVSKKRVPCP